jgi:hypothetical protein
LVIIWIQNGKALTVGMLIFQLFYEMKLKTVSLKSWHLKASADIMMKSKSQALCIIRIKYCNGVLLVGVATLPHSFLPSGT